MAAMIARALRRAADWLDGRSERVRPLTEREIDHIVAALEERKRKGGAA